MCVDALKKTKLQFDATIGIKKKNILHIQRKWCENLIAIFWHVYYLCLIKPSIVFTYFIEFYNLMPNFLCRKSYLD